MRSFRLWPNRTSVPVQWRVQGFRIRSMTFLWFISFIVLSAVSFRLTVVLGIIFLLLGIIPAALFTAYVYRHDPDLRLREITLLRNIWRGSRKPIWTNDVVRD